jgi:hypothetical protein
MWTDKARQIGVIACVLLCVSAGQAIGSLPWWLDAVEVDPPDPTRNDVVAITLFGTWPDSCVPYGSAISVIGQDVYFDVFESGWMCLPICCFPWEFAESVGRLSPGTYTIHAQLTQEPFPGPSGYEPVAEFTVLGGAFYVSVADGNDLNDGLTPETAFATIQKGIDTAQNGDTVLVYPGVYTEEVDFLGKAITVQSINEPAVLRAPGSYAVWFYHEEDANSVLKNFVITNSFAGLVFVGSFPTVSNVTVVANTGGAWAMEGAEPNITNSIFWGNWADFTGCEARYSCSRDGVAGPGNISEDPRFADANGGDYHLLSGCGRYRQQDDIWVVDEVASPCIDAGDPNHDPGNEPVPNGGRINMGAYGGTDYASMGGCVISGCWLWYQFDETDGNTAYDSSGYEHHGHVDGPNEGPGWDPNDGYPVGCLVFNGDTAVTVPADVLSDVNENITISVWLKGAQGHDANSWVFDAGTGDYRVQVAVVTDPELTVLWRAGNDTNDVLIWQPGVSDPCVLQEWLPWGFVKDEGAGTMSIYVGQGGCRRCGCLTASKSGVDKTLVNVRGAPFKIGALTSGDHDFTGKMDEFRVYLRALTDDEFGCYGDDHGCSWHPTPRDDSVDVPPDVELQWKQGDYALFHDVYFGTDQTAVSTANTSQTQGVYMGRLSLETCSYDPCGLELDTTYYWRVDEVNEPNVWKCQVWSFTVANFLVVDDFESYDETTNKIYNTWEDGHVNLSGSFIDLGIDPCEPVYSGFQSMLFIYDNSIKWNFLQYWSEAALPFDSPQDWTEAGVKILTLHFYGDPNNDTNYTEQMYVGVKDSNGTCAEVRYGDYWEDMNDLKVPEWQEWNIALPYLDDVNLASVENIYIGFGDRDNTSTQGGMGGVFFDDIRLYPPRCICPAPHADLSGDCVVDYKDLKIMADEWLCSGSCAADLYLDDKVDFKDFAVLVDSWSDSSLWP